MPSSAERSVLFFRTYREATLPLYAALVDELCASPHLPFQLATVLEDIGQDFIRLGETVNAALDRLGALEHGVDADLTVEAKIEAVIARFTLAGLMKPVGEGSPGPAPTDESFRQALRIALVMTHDLPIVGRP
ncbi:hypothetical protein LOK46_21375 [Methylobacterium sp. NMS14P]|uniref:hypothetical protein n=1 Tax=Methylobacterium sp. NMS14P TaxID=2894310 RepID=UPI00235933E9|nr:hypothetical protein [Methylobacterium sp. NMS14P]WCS23695.1 hypothetical protein LOK46_21375 [Methylobacterium sp. NMS14P]